ncbi:MAG TPA: hypothetical protein VGG22_02315 [Candidatus Baltobacteraceae bacterium]
MSWPRRHELFDIDLDAYADEEDTSAHGEAQAEETRVEPAIEQKRVSVLEAAERAGMPLEELLPKLER